MTSWLRRNRWGLLALPVAAVLAIGANAQRLQDYWWDVDLRNADATGSQGEWVAWTDDFTDALGDGTRTFRVKVSRTESTVDSDAMSDVAADLELPSDLTGVRVTMDYEAATDQVLFGCRLALLDDEGNRYVYRPITNGLRQGMHPCVPDDQPGPVPSISAGEPRTAIYGERPAQWTTKAVVVVPRSATITQVLLWWEQPDYLEVKLD